MSFGGSSGGGSGNLSGLGDVVLNSPSQGETLSYDGTNLKWMNTIPSPGSSSVGASFLFSSQISSVTVSAAVRVASNATIGQCRLSVTGAPVGSNLVVALQVSTDGGANWTTAQTLTVMSGTTSAVSANPGYALSTGDLVRVNATSVGSTTAAAGVLFQADYA